MRKTHPCRHRYLLRQNPASKHSNIDVLCISNYKEIDSLTKFTEIFLNHNDTSRNKCSYMGTIQFFSTKKKKKIEVMRPFIKILSYYIHIFSFYFFNFFSAFNIHMLLLSLYFAPKLCEIFLNYVKEMFPRTRLTFRVPQIYRVSQFSLVKHYQHILQEK